MILPPLQGGDSFVIGYPGAAQRFALVSCPINKHTNTRAIFSPDKLGTENGLAPRVERHGVASGVRTNPHQH